MSFGELQNILKFSILIKKYTRTRIDFRILNGNKLVRNLGLFSFKDLDGFVAYQTSVFIMTLNKKNTLGHQLLLKNTAFGTQVALFISRHFNN